MLTLRKKCVHWVTRQQRMCFSQKKGEKLKPLKKDRESKNKEKAKKKTRKRININLVADLVLTIRISCLSEIEIS